MSTNITAGPICQILADFNMCIYIYTHNKNLKMVLVIMEAGILLRSPKGQDFTSDQDDRLKPAPNSGKLTPKYTPASSRGT